MTADETLGRIDDTLEAWELGPDAMRWEPDAEAGSYEGKEAPTAAEIRAGLWRCPINGQAIVQRDGDTIRLIHADDEIHVHVHLLVDASVLLAVTDHYELRESCTHDPTHLHARRRTAGETEEAR